MLKICCLLIKPRPVPGRFLQSKKLYGSKPKEVKEKQKVGVVLSGSGMLDGTEIHEAAAVAVHLSKLNLEPVFYAPQCPQACVMDHAKGCPMNETRCAFIESARIARGKITNLRELQNCHVDGLVFPGGMGAVRTLSTFATEGASCTINEDVMRVLQEFHDIKKPMAFTGIAAVLPARMFSCVKITLGKKGDPRKWPHCYAIDIATSMGAELESKDVSDYSFDKQHLIFSTPAFLYEGLFHEIYHGIGIMIEEMQKIMI